ncbi:MAG: recombinase family protein, partial [bacterium]
MSRSKAIDRSKIRRVVLYARVSTDRQAKKETPIKGQIERMREYCEQHGYQVVRIFKDEGISGQTDKRPDFQEMIEIASERPKKFDAVLVWKFSRFARNLRDSIIYKDILRRKY